MLLLLDLLIYMNKKFYSLCFFIILLFSCNNTQYKNGIVVSAKVEASQVGVDILKKGGNAFDAMIATDLALAVVYPNAGNLGGGGFMVYRLNDGESGSLDYREKAPLRASKDMYLDDQKNIVKGLSTNGALAVGVPGTIAGLFEIHKKFGSLPIYDLFQPAIDLASNGFVITKKQASSLNYFRSEILTLNDSIKLFKDRFKEGDLIKNESLAKTLRLIQTKGSDAFYSGEIANKLSKYILDKGGILTLEDLKLYKPVWRDPIKFNYKNLKIITMGPPSSGGIVLGQILKMLESKDFSNLNHNDEKYIQLLVEAERLSFSDRSKYLGDPDFNKIPVKELLNKDYLTNRFKSFDYNQSKSSKKISPGKLITESKETTHYSIVDKFGNAVSVTTTLNGNYGSKLIPENLGFFLNNEMDDFSIKPGYPNMYGLIGGYINSIEPEKRMLSSMTPTIIEHNGELSMVLGSPGGPTIITSVLQTILNFYEFGFDMQKSVDLPRFHHLWLPDKIFYEENILSENIKSNLSKKKYLFNETSSVIGRVDAIHVDKNNYLNPGADKRGDDTAIGY